MAEVSSQVQEARHKALEDRLDALTKSVKGLNDPVYPNLRANGEGYSYMEDSGERVIVRRNANGTPALPKVLKSAIGGTGWYPKGYRPGSVWEENNGGGFYADLIKHYAQGHSTDFPKRMEGLYKAVQGMSEGIGSDGGFSVIPEFSQNILTRVYDSSIFEQTDNYTVAGNSMTFPRNAETSRKDGSRAGGMLGYWVAEGQTITSSKPTINTFTLKLKKVAVVVYLTDELIQDAGQSLEAYVTRKGSEEFKFQIDNSIVAGQGAGRPQGWLYSNAVYQAAKVTGQASATILPQNIVEMWRHLYAGSRNNARWYINQNTEAQLYTMALGVGTGGQVVYMPPGGLSGTPYATLMGRPVEAIEYAPPLGTPGDIMLVDPSHYVTISKGGVVQAQSIHVEFLTDQLALRFTMRVDGETWENSTVAPYQGDATADAQSSFVTLAQR